MDEIREGDIQPCEKCGGHPIINCNCKVNKPWWLEKGVTLVNRETGRPVKIIEIGAVLEVTPYICQKVFKVPSEFISTLIMFGKLHLWRLEGVPFDCMPEWATSIEFVKETNPLKEKIIRIFFIDWQGNYLKNNIIEWADSECPEAWKGKIFKITDELRRLIKCT